MLAVLLLASCREPVRQAQAVTNSCTFDGDCASGAECDRDLRICKRQLVTQQYDLFLVITRPEDQPQLQTRKLRPLRLTASQTIGDTLLELARTVQGSVFAPDGQRTIEAELVFTPVRAEPVALQVSAYTASIGPSRTQVFQATLEPGVDYDVRVLPRGLDAAKLPPASFRLTQQEASPLRFSYPAQSAFHARLLSPELLPVDGEKHRARLVEKATARVISSLSESVDGGVRLTAPAEVLQNLDAYRLEVGARPQRAPFRESIVFDGVWLRDGITLVLPTVPDPVPYQGSVLLEGRLGVTVPVGAEVVFTSVFPSAPFDRDPRGADWCARPRMPAPVQPPPPSFSCRAELLVTASPEQGFVADLLPGRYTLYVTPHPPRPGEMDNPGDAPLRYAAVQFVEDLLIQEDGGVQSGRAITPRELINLKGQVRTESGEPIEGVAVSAVALGVESLAAPADTRNLARYNRSFETRGDGLGEFTLALDTGLYDVIATPPQSSGFPAVVFNNREIVAGSSGSDFALTAATPVVLSGNVRGNRRVQDLIIPQELANATIEVYTQAPEPLDPQRRRLVRIAQTSSNARGDFWLLLPPSFGPSASAGDGGTLEAGATALRDVDAGQR